MSDPRLRLRTILLGMTVTKDDDVTPASILVMYEGGPETYRYLFYDADYDLVLSIRRHEERRSDESKNIMDVPLRYPATMNLSASAVDKTDVTATLILNKTRRAVIEEMEDHARSLGYTWSVQYDSSTNRRMGGLDPLWMDNYTISQKPMKEN